jgi:hypothetical protein
MALGKGTVRQKLITRFESQYVSMKRPFLCVLIVCSLFSACRKKADASVEAPAPPQKTQGVSLENLAAQSQNAAPLPPSPAPVAPAVDESQPTPALPTAPSEPLNPNDPLAAYNRSLQKWAQTYDIVPKDLEALKLMALNYPDMPPLPQPPPGRRLKFSFDTKAPDPRTIRISFE